MLRSFFKRLELKARDEANIAQLRCRAILRALLPTSGDKRQSSEAIHGLFWFHEATPEMELHFQRLVHETEGLIVWHRLFNPTNWVNPQSSIRYQHPSLTFPRRYDEMARHGRIVPGGYGDLALLPTILASNAQFVWVMEYDVDYAGHWEEFFGQFKNNRADLLTTMVASPMQAPKWWHWRSGKTPSSVHASKRLRSFTPLMRISRRLALEYLDALRDPKWKGHYEFLLPTIANARGLVVEDIGGEGRFCPRRRKGKNYKASMTSAHHHPGSFLWRPAVARYFVSQPEEFPEADLLYHPCKPEAAKYSPSVDSSQIYGRLKPGETEGAGRIVVAMATYNGALFLKEQLASLERQTLLPDELVIGDDRSDDETVAILREFAERAPFSVSIKERPKRLGYAANFRDVASETEWDLLFFCDQDDIWDRNKIRYVANATAEVQSMAYSHDIEVFYEGRAAKNKRLNSYFDHLRSVGLNESLCGKGCALAIRPDFIRTWGWAPDGSGLSHDAWIALLTTAMGQRALIDAPLVKHRIHGENASGWIVGAEEAKRRARSAPSNHFSSMLDFYVVGSNVRWVKPLKLALETTGMSIDPERAQVGIDALRRIA